MVMTTCHLGGNLCSLAFLGARPQDGPTLSKAGPSVSPHLADNKLTAAGTSQVLQPGIACNAVYNPPQPLVIASLVLCWRLRKSPHPAWPSELK